MINDKSKLKINSHTLAFTGLGGRPTEKGTIKKGCMLVRQADVAVFEFSGGDAHQCSALLARRGVCS
jgi:hypothetical protein